MDGLGTAGLRDQQALGTSSAHLPLQACQQVLRKGVWNWKQLRVHQPPISPSCHAPAPCSLLCPLFIIPSSQEDGWRADNGPHTVLGTGDAAVKQTAQAHCMEFSIREAWGIDHQLNHFNPECCAGEFQGDKRMYKRGLDPGLEAVLKK